MLAASGRPGGVSIHLKITIIVQGSFKLEGDHDEPSTASKVPSGGEDFLQLVPLCHLECHPDRLLDGSDLGPHHAQLEI